jgi:7-cyano-7-deazaguanine synthase in queuosine biosynthesis
MNDTIEAINNITIFDEPVGVLVSGGADSALLLYKLLSSYKATVHIFTVAIGTDEQVDVKASVDVVNACIKLTGNKNIEHHITYTEKDTSKPKQLQGLAKEYYDNGSICRIFHGITQTPPADVLKNWDISLTAPNSAWRDPGAKRNPGTGHVTRPWTNIDKKGIASLYREYNLMDTLFCYTKSCTNAESTVANYHCGKCWWCYERKWAFGQL